MNHRSLLFGVLFGFILTRVGATDYDAIFGMFSLADLHLAGVIGLAVAVSAVGFQVMRRRDVRARGGAPLGLATKPYTHGAIWGGLLFGVGWAIAGTCPGTALAQIGEGRLAGLFTFGGIVAGAWAQRRLAAPPRAVKTSAPLSTPRSTSTSAQAA